LTSGLTMSVAIVNPIPAINMVAVPFSKTIPEATWEDIYRVTVSNTYCLRIAFISFSITVRSINCQIKQRDIF